MMYFWRRIGAFVIDFSIISMFLEIMLGSKFIAPLFSLTYTNLLVDFSKLVLYLLFSILLAVGYNVICYKFFKYPLGKLLMNIKVLDENGERVSVKCYSNREWTKYVYIFTTLGLYLPYQFLLKVVKEKQTLHEKKSDTHIFM